MTPSAVGLLLVLVLLVGVRLQVQVELEWQAFKLAEPPSQLKGLTRSTGTPTVNSTSLYSESASHPRAVVAAVVP